MTTPLPTARCRQHLDRLRPTFRLLQDVLDHLEDEQDLDADSDPGIGLAVLRLLSTELRRDVEQLDLDLHCGSRPALRDYGHESEGGEL